jgi:putative ubiquitin-RnfH superfamily antitoxin RatB of RatAB toxin-antitoxin module
MEIRIEKINVKRSTIGLFSIILNMLRCIKTKDGIELTRPDIIIVVSVL